MSNEFKQSLKFGEENPSINIPLRTAGESLFLGTPGSNPVHSNMFSSMLTENYGDGDSSRYFQDLLAGSTSSGLTLVPENWGGDTLVKDVGTGFKQKRPGNLVLPLQVSPVFNISPVFSPSLFLTSPTFLSPTLSPYGMSPQQTLAQLTAQAHAALSQNEPPNNLLSSMAVFNHNHTGRQAALAEPASGPHTEKRLPNLAISVDKPQDDGYNWRKYGQKQVKGSEYPRSYYRCTTANCPVKKKVERSFDGHITEIIYKGQHTHEPPQHGRRSGNKDVVGSEGHGGNFRWTGRENDHCSQATCMMLHGPSDSEESGENYQVEDEDDEDDEHKPPKRQRNGAAGQCDGPFTHRTMTEPKIVVQTRSEIDLLDDGYRWRKYGQKVVKGNPNPRSYYKCTTVGCKVRKHVERASTDPRAVITTYEGKHSHEVPAPRGSATINNATNYEAQQLKLHNSIGVMDFDNKNQTPIALRLKQEQNLG